MSEFSDLLSSYIDEKEIKVYSLLEYCNLDRSTMYKIINGKRNPTSMEVFQKIAEFLHLTPVEYRKFKEAYLISKLGKDLYYKRKYTEKYLMNFPRNFSGEPVLFLDDLKKMKDENDYKTDTDIQTPVNTSDCTVVSTHLELNHLLHYMISSETQKSSGKIALLLQPDYGFLLNMLSSLKPAGHLKIEHTFCMSKTNQMTENHEIYNLMYLNKILPLYFSSMDYHPYYFYEDIFAHYYSMNGLSCMILSSEYVITCNSDYTRGIFTEILRWFPCSGVCMILIRINASRYFWLRNICQWIKMISTVLCIQRHQTTYYSRKPVWFRLLTGSFLARQSYRNFPTGIMLLKR